MRKLALHWQIAIAIFLAALAGTLTGTDTALLGISFYACYNFLGTLFLNALKMIIVPLIASSIICGVANIAGSDNLSRLGGKTLGYYMLTSFFAIMVGLVFVNAIQPGIIAGEPAGETLNLNTNPDELDTMLTRIEGRSTSDIVDVFLRMVPPNIVQAAADGQMLGLIFFSMLFGYFMTTTKAPLRETMLNFWQGVFDTMMAITLWVMKFAPLGVFGLVAKTVAATGFSAFQPLLIFFLTVCGALAFHFLITLSVLLKVIGKLNPRKVYKTLSPVLLTAFSTASSSATLPLTLETVEKQAGVSNRTTSFVLPLGATVNMDGTALYECVAAIFIAQAYGLDLSFSQQFIVVLTALLTSIGVAGIPAASLVAIAVILGVIGLPLEAMGLLLVTDRILDMMRTAVNVFSDACGAIIIARTENEKTALAD